MIKRLFFTFFVISTLFASDFLSLPPSIIREQINRDMLAIPAEKREVYSVSENQVNVANRKTAIRIYSPSNKSNLPIVILIHGGGWVAGSLETHDNLARFLCNKAQVLVISVDYATSPEAKFPLALEQCYDVLLWTREHAKEYQGDSSRLAVVGDSAGANMSAVLCLLSRDRKGPPIHLQVLINPPPDLRRTFEGGLQDILQWFAIQYINKPEDIHNPYVSPILDPDLKGLPPALILLAENDELRVDGENYASRLRQSGVPTIVYTQKGVGHLGGEGARASKVAEESLQVAVEVLSKKFYTSL